MGAMLAMTGLMLAGAAIKTIGGIKAGNAMARAGEKQQEAANSQAELSDFNAQVADLQATDAIARGEQEEARFRTLIAGAIGSQRVGFAAANIDVGFGSAVDVQADAAMLGELDALTIKTNAKREAWGYQVQGEDLRRRGQIQRKEGSAMAEAGRAQRTASRFDVAGSLINTGASLLEIQYGFGRGK